MDSRVAFRPMAIGFLLTCGVAFTAACGGSNSEEDDGSGGASTGGTAATGGTSSTGGTGGTTGTGGDTGEPVLTNGGDCALGAGVAGTDPLIDDFEDGNLDLPETDGRAGAWFVAGMADPLAVVEEGAMHATSGEEGWPSVGVPLGSEGCYDGSTFSGISFRIKSDTNKEIKFVVATPPSTPPPRGICMDETQALCFDHFGKFLPVTAEWQEVTLMWDDLNTSNWGEQPPPGYSFEHEILEIGFGVTTINEALDLWVDDVKFVP